MQMEMCLSPAYPFFTHNRPPAQLQVARYQKQATNRRISDGGFPAKGTMTISNNVAKYTAWWQC
jgi:hypothetical protein